MKLIKIEIERKIMTLKYFVLKRKYDETNVIIQDIPSNLKKKYQLLKGIARLSDWPEDIILEFSKQRSEGMNLTDYVENSFGWLLISNRFKRVLEEFGAASIEYLPVKIKNHKGRIAGEAYWIGNFLVLTEAVDRNLSMFEADALDENQIFRFDKLVLRDDVLNSNPLIFRLKEQPRMVIARQDLVERFEKEGLTGVKFIETNRFKTYDPEED